MSEKLSPLLRSLDRKPMQESWDDRDVETVLMGFVAVIVVPAACVLAVLAIPFWLVGLVVRYIEKIER